MKCDLGDYEVDVEVIRKQNKNVYFRINDDYSLCVTCPKYMTDFDVKRLIKKNEEALKKMYKRALKHKKDSSKFLYLGKEYNIVCVPDLEIVGFKDDCVYTKDLEALEKFTDRECLKVFTGEINICRKCFNDLPDFALRVRKMRTRWGVCNTRRKIITLNSKLLDYELWIIDYVIIHEMCHFYEGNHSKNFWALVEQACPRYKEAKKALKE